MGCTNGGFGLNQQSLSSFLWSVAEILRGDYRQADYGKVILPFTVLRRLDCVLAPTKAAVLAELDARRAQDLNPAPFLLRKAGQAFYNTSTLDLKKLLGDRTISLPTSTAISRPSRLTSAISLNALSFRPWCRLSKSGLLY
jgi:type I restriction enzyme M protein